jgi:DNA-binding MarR family transcriptional regulator
MSEFIAAFTRAAKLLRAEADVAMSKHGVRVGQNLVLEALWSRDGQTPGELAQTLDITTPTVVKMSSRMEAAGLVVRKPDDRDGRLVRLYLTEHGRSLQQAISDELIELERWVTRLLSPTERQQVLIGLRRMAESLATSRTSAGVSD